MTAADDYFWIFEQAVSYYQFTLVNYKDSMIKVCCLQEAAVTRIGNRRLIKPDTWIEHTYSEGIFISEEYIIQLLFLLCLFTKLYVVY